MITLVIIGLFSVLAFWKNSLMAYLLAVPVALVYGLQLANANNQGTALWASGIVVALFGIGCLFKVGTMVLLKRR